MIEAEPPGSGADGPTPRGLSSRALLLKFDHHRRAMTNYQPAAALRDGVACHGPRADLVQGLALDGRVVTVTPEFDEVRRIARDKGCLREVLDARAEGRRLLIREGTLGRGE